MSARRWLTVEQIRDGRRHIRCTLRGAGLAIVGLAAAIVCSFAVGAKFRFGYDDSLDVVGVHFVGGVVGVLLIGLLATEVMTGGAQGLFYGGGFAQLGKQSLGALVVGVYAFAVSYVLAKVIDRFMGFRVSAEDETTGVDFTQHAETAYAEGVHGHQPSRRPTRSATSARRVRAPRRPKKAETLADVGTDRGGLSLTRVGFSTGAGEYPCRRGPARTSAPSANAVGCNARAGSADEVSSCRLVRDEYATAI